MIRREVVYTPEAERDLVDLYDYLVGEASPATAIAYMGRVRAWLSGFDMDSERGTLRREVRPGLRTVGFERRITAAFMVDETQVVILRVFYGGQDWRAVLRQD